jgi:HEAT repeat protein
MMIVAAFVLVPAGGFAQDEAAAVDRLLGQIRSEPSGNARSEMAKDLAVFLTDLPDSVRAQAIDEGRIDAIASLLNDENDSVRFWAAGALGKIGPTATRAVPALKEAHAKIVATRRLEGPVILGIDSSVAIVVALERITGEEPKCPYALMC